MRRVEGYHVYLGGGYAQDASIGREFQRDVPAEEIPALIERLLRVYLAERNGPDESFKQFAERLDLSRLQTLAEERVP